MGSERDLHAAPLAELAATMADVEYAYRLDPEPGLEYVSPSVEALVGYAAEEFLADPDLGTRLVDGADAGVAESLAAAIPGAVVDVSVRAVARDGRTVWTAQRCRVEERADGARVLYGVVRDVTAERAAEIERDIALQRYRVVAENTSDFVTESDADFVITWVSPSVTAVTGWAPQQVVGRRGFDFFHPDDLPHVLAAAGGLSRDVTAYGTARVRCADGSYIWLAQHVRVVRDAAGSVVARVHSWRDATAEVHATQALHAAERRFQLLAENASDVVYELGPDGRFAWVSPSVDAVLGWDPHALVGTLPAALMHPADAPLAEAALLEAQETNTSTRVELRLRHRAGRFVWMAAVGSALRREREGGGFVVSLRDVDELVRTRERDAIDRARLRAVLDSMLDPYLLLGAVRDDAGRVVDFTVGDANPAACAFEGRDRDELVGSRLLDLHPAVATTDLFAAYVSVVDTGTPLVLDDWTYPQELFGGELRRYDLRAVRVGDAVSATWRDVTERVSTVQALAEQERRLRLLLDSATDVVFDLAPDGSYRWVSPSVRNSLGWRPEDLLGRTGAEFIHPDDHAAVLASREGPQEGVAVVEEFRYRTADGGYRWMSGRSREVRDDDGTLTGRFVGLRDVHDQKLSADALAASESRFRLLAEKASDVVAILRRDGSISWVSPSVTRTFGWDPETYVTFNVAELLHPDDVPLIADVIARADSGVDTVHVQHRVRCADGGFRWVDSALTFEMDQSGRPVLGYTVSRDIHDRVETRRALEASREMLTGIVQGLLDPWVLLEPVRDETGRVTDFVYVDANRAACDFNRLTREALLGRTLLDLLPGHRDAGLLERYAEVIETGQPLVLDDYPFAPETSSGTLGWYDNRAVRVAGMLSFTWRDVTDRHLDRQRLQESEERFRSLAMNSSDAVLRAGPDSVYEWASPSTRTVLGWDPSQLVGHSVFEFTDPADAEAIRAARAAANAGTPNTTQVRFRRPDGSYRWVAASAQAIYDGQHQVVGRVVTMRDVDDQVRSAEALARSERQFRLAMDGAPVGMALVGLDRRFLDANPALCEIVGRDEEWLLEHTVADVLDPADDEVDRRARARVLAGEASHETTEKRLVRADGSKVWVMHSISLMRDDDGSPLFYVSQFADITESRRALARLAYLAGHDSLTQLANRAQLVDRMGEVLARSPRTGHEVAVLFADVDGMKPVNDTHGHSAGDAVLVEVARRLQARVRTGDLVSRFGGDEFVVVLDGVHDLADATRIADQLRRAVSLPIAVAGTTVRVSLSVGVALATPDADPEHVIREADAALYEAKRTGRDRTVAFPDVSSAPSHG